MEGYGRHRKDIGRILVGCSKILVGYSSVEVMIFKHTFLMYCPT